MNSIYLDPIDLHIKPHHTITIKMPGRMYNDGDGLCVTTLRYMVRVGARTRPEAVTKARDAINKIVAHT